MPRRRLRRRLLGLIVVGLALVAAGCLPVTAPTPAPPGAPNPYGAAGKGEFVALCPFSQRGTIDPIVAPGSTTFWHEHDFFGNETTDPNSTAVTLLAQATTCVPGFDSAAYWVPTLLHWGTPVSPVSASFFYRVVAPQDPSKVQPFPTGLIMVAGSSAAVTAQPASIVRWGCAGSSATGATIPWCHRHDLVLDLHFPECWDGVHLDSADHKSHMAYAQGASCPADHPVLVPQLTFEFQWNVSGRGVTVSSDHTMSGTDVTPGLTAHGDFINAWSPEIMQQRVATCLRAAVICDENGTVTGS